MPQCASMTFVCVISISWCYVDVLVSWDNGPSSRPRIQMYKCSRCFVVASRALTHTHIRTHATPKYVETYTDAEMRAISCTSLGYAFTRLTYSFVPCRQSGTKQVEGNGKRFCEKKPSAWYLWTAPEARVQNSSRSFQRASWPPYYYAMKIDMSRALANCTLAMARLSTVKLI